MQSPSLAPTLIIRHRKENLKKCSLSGLEGHPHLLFLQYPLNAPLPPLDNYLLLSFEGPPLTEQDCTHGLILIDATWRYAEKMEKQLFPEFPRALKRTLPPQLRTAYPRRQQDCLDPERGLASIEALYAAHRILGYAHAEDLLSHYHWKENFLNLNRAIFSGKSG